MKGSRDESRTPRTDSRCVVLCTAQGCRMLFIMQQEQAARGWLCRKEPV
jgi:hypothetical protein